MWNLVESARRAPQLNRKAESKMRNEWRLPVDTVKWQRGDWGLKMGENKVKFGVMILFLEALGRSCDCSGHRQDVSSTESRRDRAQAEQGDFSQSRKSMAITVNGDDDCDDIPFHRDAQQQFSRRDVVMMRS